MLQRFKAIRLHRSDDSDPKGHYIASVYPRSVFQEHCGRHTLVSLSVSRARTVPEGRSVA
jgi:hypothetical protein